MIATSSRIIDLLLWSILIIIPSAISFYDIQNLFSPFKFPLLLALTGLIIIFFLWSYKRLIWDKSTMIALLFLLLILVASLNAYNQELAIIGFYNGYGRYEGFLAILSYLILWLAAKNFLIVDSKRIIFFFIGLIPFSVYALVQYYGMDPLVLNYGFVPRIFSTIGNPNFVGSLAVILVVLSSILFTVNRNWLFFVFSLLFFSTLVICQTRSAWIAGALVISSFLFYWMITKKDYLYPILLILGYTFVCLILFNTQKKNTVIEKSKTITKELDLSNEYGGSGRLKIWAITQKVLLQNPWTGVGPENLKLAIKKEQPKLHNEYYKRTRTTIDKAHNEYLHLAVTCGIPALLTYLLLILMSFKSSITKFFDSSFNIAFSLAVMAYLIQAFFNISVIAVAPVFWIFLGALAGNRFKPEKLMKENNQENQIKVIK